MTNYCNIGDKATIHITKPNEEIVVSRNSPINVEVIDESTTGVTVRCYGDVESGNSHNPGYANYFDVSGTQNDRYSLRLVECTVNIGCGATSPNQYGEKYYQAQVLKNGTYTGFHFDTAGFYSISIIEVVYPIPKFRLKITNNNGVEEFNKTYSSRPEYSVACGDNCPPDKVKVLITAYPGYKCREKCPLNTACECDCGDVICCYGSQGQVLATIPK
jgi:hypothetical protein